MSNEVKKQGTADKVEIIKDLIDMNNDGKITDDLPKIIAFLGTIKVLLGKFLGGSKEITKK